MKITKLAKSASKIKNGSKIGGEGGPYNFAKGDDHFQQLTHGRLVPYTEKQVMRAMRALHRLVIRQSENYHNGKLYKAGIVESTDSDDKTTLYKTAFDLLSHLHDAKDEAGVQLCMTMIAAIAPEIDVDSETDETDDVSDATTANSSNTDETSSDPDDSANQLPVDTQDVGKISESIDPDSIPVADAYGGVLIKDGKILLREPTNHYGGYVWTFAKGRIEDGDTPEETAIREVFEETGYHGEIIKLIPKKFGGDTSVTVFFLMEPVGAPSDFGWETQSIKWCTKEEAIELIKMTKSTRGAARDLQVLEAAFAAA